MLKCEIDEALSRAPAEQRSQLAWWIGCALAAGWVNLTVQDDSGWWWSGSRWRMDWQVVVFGPCGGRLLRVVPENPGVA